MAEQIAKSLENEAGLKTDQKIGQQKRTKEEDEKLDLVENRLGLPSTTRESTDQNSK